jgi:hypothetical protein
MIPISIVRTVIAVRARIIGAMIAAVSTIRMMIAVVTAVPAVVCAAVHSALDARDTERRKRPSQLSLSGVKGQLQTRQEPRTET